MTSVVRVDDSYARRKRCLMGRSSSFIHVFYLYDIFRNLSDIRTYIVDPCSETQQKDKHEAFTCTISGEKEGKPKCRQKHFCSSMMFQSDGCV